MQPDTPATNRTAEGSSVSRATCSQRVSWNRRVGLGRSAVFVLLLTLCAACSDTGHDPAAPAEADVRGSESSWSPYAVPYERHVSADEIAAGYARIGGTNVSIPQAALEAESLFARVTTLRHANDEESSAAEVLQVAWYWPDGGFSGSEVEPDAFDRLAATLWLVCHRGDNQQWRVVDTFETPGGRVGINWMRLERIDDMPGWIRMHRGGGAGTGLYAAREDWYDIELGRSVLSIPMDVNDANTTLWTSGGSHGTRLTSIDGVPAVVGVLWHRQEFVGSLDERGFWYEDPHKELAKQFLAFGLAAFVQDPASGDFQLDPNRSDWDPDHLDVIGWNRVTGDKLRGLHIERIRRH